MQPDFVTQPFASRNPLALLVVLAAVAGCAPSANPLTVGWLPRGPGTEDLTYVHSLNAVGSFDFTEAWPGADTVGLYSSFLWSQPEGGEYHPHGALEQDHSIVFGAAEVEGGWTTDEGVFHSNQDDYDEFVRGTWVPIEDWSPRDSEAWEDDFDEYDIGGEDCLSDGELYALLVEEFEMAAFYPRNTDEPDEGDWGYRDADNPYVGLPHDSPVEYDEDGIWWTENVSAVVWGFYCDETAGCAPTDPEWEGLTEACYYAERYADYDPDA